MLLFFLCLINRVYFSSATLFFCNILYFFAIHSFSFLHFFRIFLIFYFPLRNSIANPIHCEIDLGGVLTTFYKVISALASSKTCTTKFWTSSFWCRCWGTCTVEFLIFIFCFYFSFILIFYFISFYFIFAFSLATDLDLSAYRMGVFLEEILHLQTIISIKSGG